MTHPTDNPAKKERGPLKKEDPARKIKSIAKTDT